VSTVFLNFHKGGDDSIEFSAPTTPIAETEAVFLRFNQWRFTEKIWIYTKVDYSLSYTPECTILSVRAMKRKEEKDRK
jgi:hypothetical protein